MRLFPDSLIGRTLLLVAAIMLALIIGSALLLHDERNEHFHEMNRRHLIEQAATFIAIVHDAGSVERQRMVKRSSLRGFKISLSAEARAIRARQHMPGRRLYRHLRRMLPFIAPDGLIVQIAWPPFSARGQEHARPSFGRKPGAIVISVRMPDAQWLNLHSEPTEGPPAWAVRKLGLILLLLILLSFIGVVVARRMAKPMAALADAANQVGRGEVPPLLPERGPREVRQTIRAFNRMQERLRRQLNDRSLMLTAISHDLRTPITALRLRAEYIDDDEMRQKTLATLAEMEQILSVTLSFAKDEAADEQSRESDLATMLQSLCDDHADLGGNAVYSGPDRLIVKCRPTALRRAVGNLIENAVKYGNEARVTLSRESGDVTILIEDSGPGIPEPQLEQVFTPFFRLEESRSRETGGIGLGLALARTLIHAQGGELVLRNRPQGGLVAEVRLLDE